MVSLIEAALGALGSHRAELSKAFLDAWIVLLRDCHAVGGQASLAQILISFQYTPKCCVVGRSTPGGKKIRGMSTLAGRRLGVGAP